MRNNSAWKGNIHKTLERFAAIHRFGNEQLKAATERTDYQLPCEWRILERFLCAIVFSDPEMREAVSQVKAKKDLDGPLNDCPVLLYCQE